MISHYFIPGVTPEMEKTLRVNIGMKCWEWYTPGGGERSIVLLPEYLSIVLYHLGMEAFGKERRDRDNQDIAIVSVRPVTSLATPQVVALNWRTDSYSRDSQLFLRVAEEVLLPVVKKRILVCSYYNTCNPASIQSGDFHVHIRSSKRGAQNDGAANRCRTAFGIDLNDSHGWNWFRPSGEGELILNPDNSRPIAELIGDHLYIFIPLTNKGMERGVDVFRKILEAAVEHLVRDPAEKKRLSLEWSKTDFVRTCNVVAVELDQESSQIASHQATIELKKKALLTGHTSVQTARQELKRVCWTMEEAEARLGQEFDSILKIPKVRRVAIREDRIEVFTNTIYCRDPRTGKWHEIGKFKIAINFSTELPVWFYNQTRKINAHSTGMHAPHVFAEGKACFGDSMETFLQLRRQLELPAMVMYAIRFLESVNVDDRAGAYINMWPEVAESVVSAASAA